MNEIRIIIEGLNELTEAVRRLAGHNGIQDAGMALSSYARHQRQLLGQQQDRRYSHSRQYPCSRICSSKARQYSREIPSRA